MIEYFLLWAVWIGCFFVGVYTNVVLAVFGLFMSTVWLIGLPIYWIIDSSCAYGC